VVERTLRTGGVVRTPHFTLRYLRGEGPPGAAFLAGRRVGKAVRRNRAKRILREAFWSAELDLPNVEALVFIATERAASEDFTDIKRSVLAALRRVSDRTG